MRPGSSRLGLARNRRAKHISLCTDRSSRSEQRVASLASAKLSAVWVLGDHFNIQFSSLPFLPCCCLPGYRTTGSQHGRGWQGPLWVTQPNPLPKQGHPEQAAQHRGQAGLKYLQRRRLHSLPGQPGPGLRHPQREEVLPCTVNPPLPSLPQTTLCSVYPSR